MTRRTQWIAVIAAAVLAAGTFAQADPLPLAGEQLVKKGHADVKADGNGILLKFDNPYEDSGLTLTPPKGQEFWDLSSWKYLVLDVENLSTDTQMRLLMQMNSGGPDRKTRREVNIGIALNPGEKRTWRLLIPHEWYYGAPEGVPGVRNIDSAKIQKIDFIVQWPFEHSQKDLVNCRISNVRTQEKIDPSSGPRTSKEQYAPFMDEYGQFMHDEWPTKIHSSADLRKQYMSEKAELDKATRPDEWDKFGGWKNGPQLKATGSFRTEKYQGKWYLVDPEGKLFFSNGIDVISKYNDPLKVLPGKENWFKTLPEGAKIYQPTELALRQKYGTENYFPEYIRNVSKRMDAWGINTLGDWSSLDLMDLGRTPYTLQLTDYDWKMPRIANSKIRFYDVFDQRYIDRMKSLMKIAAEKDPLVTKSLTDPMCIGYWIDNELNFGNRGKLVYTDEVLKSPAKQAAKIELVNDLKAKYGGIEKLNDAWKTQHADWDALLASTSVPDTKEYKADAREFFEKSVDQYFRLAREAIKSVAPNRLYLGSRFISTDAVRATLYKSAGKYCDVLSVNIYSASAANFPVKNLPDMPMIIGEFHFGTLDRGMFNASLCPAGPTQADRAMAYTRFMQGVLVHPNFVGAHWFQYRDQPLTGRGDGEAYQIGFVDVTDTPYEELCKAARSVGEHMYQYRLNGKLVNDMAGGK